ncbi:MAG TPA: glutathione S-transferase family protein [Gammaproteobacteria bacterium]
MRFFDFRLAPSPTKVRIFIAEKNLEIDTVDVNLREGEHRTPEYLDKIPTATVPALELDDGTLLTESHAICRYLEIEYPEPNLMGVDAKEQALVLQWNDIATLEGYIAAQEVLRNEQPGFAGRALPGPNGYEQIAALVGRGRERLEHFFDKLERQLADSPFVALDRYTYADLVTYVYKGFAERVTHDDFAQGRANVARWAASVAARPAVQAATG